jgi:uncharacterized membrane protein
MPGVLRARRRLIISAAAGLVAGAAASRIAVWQVSVLFGWCAVAATFVGVAGVAALPADSERTRALAAPDDETRFTADLVILLACLASLVGAGFLLVTASSRHGADKAGLIGLAVASVVLSWTVVHTVFTLRYADLYYSNGGGIDFNQPDPPDYRDFAYVAFTIGMAYQVSDTNLTTKEMRRTALRHGVLSFLFGTAIIAMTINVVAGLVH